MRISYDTLVSLSQVDPIARECLEAIKRVRYQTPIIYARAGVFVYWFE